MFLWQTGNGCPCVYFVSWTCFLPLNYAGTSQEIVCIIYWLRHKPHFYLDLSVLGWKQEKVQNNEAKVNCGTRVGINPVSLWEHDMKTWMILSKETVKDLDILSHYKKKLSLKACYKYGSLCWNYIDNVKRKQTLTKVGQPWATEL